MSSIGATLLKRLESVERPGDFCTGGLRTIFMPAIDVRGVGRIALPLLPAQAESLVAIAEAAPYGRGADTFVDSSVRRTWQINPAKVQIGGAPMGQDAGRSGCRCGGWAWRDGAGCG